MHNHEYIASGVLELYAAGGLTQEERAAVEERAAASPEIRAALDEACAAMEAYARQYARSPRPELKDRILAQLHTTPAPTPPVPDEPDNQYVMPMPVASEGSAYRWMFAASITLFLLSGLLSLHFYNKWQQAEERLNQLAASEQLLAAKAETASLRLAQQETALDLYRNPDVKRVTLAGVEAHPDAQLTIFWNPASSQVFVDQVTLPAAPAGKAYQLWALDNGKPIDAGLLAETKRPLTLQQMKNIRSAQAFAVTLEPAGGSVNPTLEQLVVMGEVES
ncbi:anti-sigma factor [Botryobacter ruber]|uniref:anti-sigma factor n=1 Tax=Botryobacter ruber TaxID=2171629 RepID=UPI000F6470D8|nr:anti-sigma factor [Botryobacter ruber]